MTSLAVSPATAKERPRGLRLRVRGVCQGVGFRPWVFRTAHRLALGGTIRNLRDGVDIEAFGSAAALAALERALREAPPPGARLEAIASEEIPARSVRAFRIVASAQAGPRRPALVPDLPTCPDCLAELARPEDRRHGYALLTCCACGPRYTLARTLPFDRAGTAMADFPLCEACRDEYSRPESRRFHAQTLACAACGPRLSLRDPAGEACSASDPVAEAARELRAGGVLAVKGVGGFHLACMADDVAAVRRLRAAKRREARPFAVMVKDLDTARHLAHVDAEAARLLTSPERPVVLAPGKQEAVSGFRLAPGVTAGSGLVGLLLPYTGVHHLLLQAVGAPLVMTSGNRSGEPIARSEAEARGWLAEAVDRILSHDRPIERSCDDSVVRVVGGRPTLIRRARGYAPRPIRLPRPVRAPILACGGAWKNAFALVEDDAAWLSPHVGDLESFEACRAFDETVADLEALLGIRPQLVAHDLHPAYYPTRYARARGLARVAVAHHHAHAVSVMAEHGLEGPALALVWDGTGLGPDGTAWGGELLRVAAGRFERLATFRPLALPGADRAIEEPWRVALAALDEAFGGSPPPGTLPLFDDIAPARLEAVRRIARSPRLAPRAHGVGRFFDAVGALVLDRGRAAYEGELALALESCADGDPEAPPYPYRLGPRPACPEAGAREIDLRPTLRALVTERLAGADPGAMADRFHATLAAAGAEALCAARDETGDLPVVVAGGCFQNDLLVRGLRARLEPTHPLHTALELPPGDGGLALGQAVVADALTRERS